MPYLFKDRQAAGRDLAVALERYRGPATLVLGLPRGGVITANEVAKALGAELSVIVTRKIGAPGNPEYAIGAVAEGGEVVLNDEEISMYGIPRAFIDNEIDQQKHEIQRRIELYRAGKPLPNMKGRPVLVVDDGVATGYTMLAALRAGKQKGASPVVMATPVIPLSTLDHLQYDCDNAVVLAAPEPFYAVGLFYEDFEQVSDQDVLRILGTTRAAHAA
ncbi:MAG TPA: phosphoribosyltransferase [Chloroflexota bacterium]|nr:phosphoribosyltransferase [Chloroflexota bacterium]